MRNGREFRIHAPWLNDGIHSVASTVSGHEKIAREGRTRLNTEKCPATDTSPVATRGVIDRPGGQESLFTWAGTAELSGSPLKTRKKTLDFMGL